MNKPGISMDTGPAVRTAIRRINELNAASELAHQVPAAEYVALLAIAATAAAEACMEVVSSVGLDPTAVARCADVDPQAYQKAVIDLIRSKK